MKFTGERRSCDRPFASFVSHTITRRSGSGYGRGRSTIRSSRLNTADVAPMPSARPNTAAIVNAGLRRSSRHPKRTSWRIVSMPGLDGTGGGRVVKRMDRDQQILDDPAANEVFVNNPFERGRIAGAVPRAFGIDHGNGTTFANAKAVRLRAQNAALLRQSQLFQPAFEKVPRGQAAFFLAAFRVGLIAAQEDVPARHRHADAARGRLLGAISHQRTSRSTQRPGLRSNELQ